MVPMRWSASSAPCASTTPRGLPVGDFLHAADPAALRGWIGIEDEAKD